MLYMRQSYDIIGIYLIKQRKLAEASQLLAQIIDKNNNLEIIPLVTLRRAIILMTL